MAQDDNGPVGAEPAAAGRPRDVFHGIRSTSYPKPWTRRGQDTTCRIELELEDVAFGVTREISVDLQVVCTACASLGTAPGTATRSCAECDGSGLHPASRAQCERCQGFGTVITDPCTECAGEGRVRTRRKLALKIPPGVDNGTRIQLAAEGDAGLRGGFAGDLFVEIVELPHPVFQRRGDDLHCTVTLPMAAAALGTTLQLPTLDGPADADVHAGIQSGEAITLRGKGIQHLRDSGRGDLILHIEVRTPTGMDAAQTAQLRQFAEMRGEEGSPGEFAAGRQALFSRLRETFDAR